MTTLIDFILGVLTFGYTWRKDDARTEVFLRLHDMYRQKSAECDLLWKENLHLKYGTPEGPRNAARPNLYVVTNP